MELSSAPLHKAQVSWRGLLLTDPVTTPSIQVNQTIDKNLTSVFLKCLSIDINISIHWFFKGQSLRITNRMNLTENNSTLQIVPARREDSGDYQCEVSNPLGSKKSDPIQLDIIDPVTTPSIQVNQTIDKNLTSVFLKCLSIDINISIHWFFKGQSLRITNRMNLTENNSTLQIVPARRVDSGDYQCEVSNPLGSKKSDPIQLDVIDPLNTPFIQVTNKTVKNLISVFLTCLSNGNGISYQWFFKGNILVITNRIRLSENNHTLQIDSVRIEDSGDYQCEVSNEVSSKRSDPIQLDIIHPVTPPSIQVTNSTVKNLISVFLTCLSNDTGISIHWLFQGQNLVISNRISLSENNRTLQIDSVRSEDSGDYQCQVSNQVSSKRSDPIQLDIIHPVTPPSIQVTNSTVKDLISVFLNCLSNDTGIFIHWLFKGKSLVVTNRTRLSTNNRTLQIDSVKIEDSGDYQCEVSNQVSSKRSDPIQLDIIRQPAKPKHVPSLRGIIGIVAQCLMGLIAVIFVLVFLWRSHRGREPQIENDIKQVDNEPTNPNEPSNLNKTSKEASNVKHQKKKKSKGKK
nr:carcinoembryonic antigen-related cell adhesion molecule 1-like isoform X3 [Peromyscus maniculatus bairdii]